MSYNTHFYTLFADMLQKINTFFNNLSYEIKLTTRDYKCLCDRDHEKICPTMFVVLQQLKVKAKVKSIYTSRNNIIDDKRLHVAQVVIIIIIIHAACLDFRGSVRHKNRS